jgi:hypothetical protein
MAELGLVPHGYEDITVANTAKTLTAATYGASQKAFMTLETAQIRVRFDGTAPTTTVGHLVEVGDTIILDAGSQLSQFQAIRTGATSGVLRVSYFKIS